MTGLLDRLTGKTSKDKSEGEHDTGSGNKKNTGRESTEQSFSILPHPAKSNDPADLQPNPPEGSTGCEGNEGQGIGGGVSGPGLGAARDPAFALHTSTPGIVIPEGLDQQPVATKGELQARAAELNKQD